MITKVDKPFMVISEITGIVYKIDTVEVDDKGRIKNYIIDGKVWSPGRFRSKTYIEKNEYDESDTIKDILQDIIDELEELMEEI